MLRRALTLFFAAGLIAAAPASAGYEQVANFGESGEGAMLHGANGLAVNVSGAGGVPAGSLYAAARNVVARYSPKGEFREGPGAGASATAKRNSSAAAPTAKRPTRSVSPKP